MALFVKICGLTTVDDALVAVDAGADAVGINLIPVSKRAVNPSRAAAIVRGVAGRAETVAVVADCGREALMRLRDDLGVDRLQLHGDEPDELVRELEPLVFKAVRVGDEVDVARARDVPGVPLLVDAKVEGQLGGTGAVLDWSLVVALAAERSVLLAGGLTPENVSEAVCRVRPWGVDVASGVETQGDPRRKDPRKIVAFIQAARRAADRLR